MALDSSSTVGVIRIQLMHMLLGYFRDLKGKGVDIDTNLHSLELGDSWLIEFILIVEEKYNITITDEMAKKHFIRIRNAAKYLSGRDLGGRF